MYIIIIAYIIGMAVTFKVFKGWEHTLFEKCLWSSFWPLYTVICCIDLIYKLK